MWRKTAVIATLKVKRLQKEESNEKLDKSFAKHRTYPGTTLMQFAQHIIPKRNRLIVHGVYNDSAGSVGRGQYNKNDIQKLTKICR